MADTRRRPFPPEDDRPPRTAGTAPAAERVATLRRARAEWRAIDRRDFFPPAERELAAAALRELAAVPEAAS